MRLGQRILLLMAGLVGLLVVAALVLVATFDPNDHREQIQRIVTEQSGRKFELAGDIELAFFPQVAIEAGPARLGDAPGFGPQPFLTIDRVAVQLRLLPLLFGRIELGDLRLERPTVRLILDADGTGNWSDLAGDGPAQDRSNFSAGRVAIDGGRILIEDRQSGNSYAIRDLDLDTGRFAVGRGFTVEASWVLEHADLTLRTAVTTSLTLVMQPLEIELDDSRIDVELLGQAFGLAGLTARLRAAHAHVAADRSLLESLALEARPRLERWPEGLPLQLEATRVVADLDAEAGEVTGLELEIAGARIEVPHLTAEQLLEAPQLGGSVRLAPFDLRDGLHQLGVEVPTSDPTALTRIALAGRLALTPDRVALEDLDLELDATRARGWLAINGFETPGVRFDLAADAIDLDRYLPPQEPGTPPGEVPVAWLQERDVAGVLRIAQARVAGIELDGIRLVFEGGDRPVGLQQSVATLEPGPQPGEP